MSVEQTNISVKVDSGSSGIIAVLLSFFFGCFGFFFASYWLVYYPACYLYCDAHRSLQIVSKS